MKHLHGGIYTENTNEVAAHVSHYEGIFTMFAQCSLVVHWIRFNDSRDRVQRVRVLNVLGLSESRLQTKPVLFLVTHHTHPFGKTLGSTLGHFRTLCKFFGFFGFHV